LATRQLDTLIRHLRRTVRPAVPDSTTDAQLLERFVQGRDEGAFELLVWRHGAMVLNVCQRVLRCEHDAEDAFQASFLALACKAAAIGKRASVGSWLYKVAYRVALRARSRSPAQPLPQEPPADTAEPLADLLRWELRSVLDEEVRRLSDKYRAAFVLCCMEGQTIAAAAQTLGCPQGTVGTWLARARRLLRRRLASRGLGPSAPEGCGSFFAALPAALVSSTARAAVLGSEEKALAAGLISAQVAALTKGAVPTMTLTKWILATGLVLALSLLGGGLAFRTHRAQAIEPTAQGPIPVALHLPARERNRGVVLEWKFEQDVPFYEERTTVTDQVMKVMGNDVRQTQRQKFFFRWMPAANDEDDNWVLRQKVLGVILNIDIGGNKIQYDSTKKDSPETPLAEFYKSLVGSEFTVTMNKGFRVAKIEGRDHLIKKLSAANPGLVTLLPQVLGENALRELAETPFAGLREGPVRPGHSWARRSKLDLGPFGECWKTSTYTYQGKHGKLDRIQVEIALKCQPPAGGDGLPVKVRESEVTSAEGAGVILFDRDKGRVFRVELNLRLKAKLTTRTGDRDTEVELLQTQKTTVQTSGTNPLASAVPAADLTTQVKRLREANERLRQENQRLRRKLRAVEGALRGEGKPKE
jgi:RNA polymerase sigma factor (sigma-70 family)